MDDFPQNPYILSLPAEMWALAGKKEISNISGVSQGYATYIGIGLRQNLTQRRISSRNDVLLVAGQVT